MAVLKLSIRNFFIGHIGIFSVSTVFFKVGALQAKCPALTLPMSI